MQLAYPTRPIERDCTCEYCFESSLNCNIMSEDFVCSKFVQKFLCKSIIQLTNFCRDRIEESKDYSISISFKNFVLTQRPWRNTKTLQFKFWLGIGLSHVVSLIVISFNTVAKAKPRYGRALVCGGRPTT